MPLLSEPRADSATDHFRSRRQGVFVYSVQKCSPNGDPLMGNAPRQDPVTRRLLVSKYRIKRTVRDYLRDYEGFALIADGSPKTIDERLRELVRIAGEAERDRSIYFDTIDFALFGAVINPQDKDLKKEFPTSSFRGPVQVFDGESLHPVDYVEEQGTSAFKGTDKAAQKSFRTSYSVPFALISASWVASPAAARITGATDDMLEIFRSALWHGTNNLLTGSKTGHRSRLMLEFRFDERHPNTLIPFPEKRISPMTRSDTAARGIEDMGLDLSGVWELAERYADRLEGISLVTDGSVAVQMGQVPKRISRMLSRDEWD